MSRIFISHSAANNSIALAIAKWLEELGWGDYFLDISSDRGLLPGERWQHALRVAADRCEAVLFLISPAWRDSRWCLAEFLMAKQLGKPVFGVLVEATSLDTLPKEMTAEWQLCDLVNGAERRTFEVAFDPVVPFTTVNLAEVGLSRLKRGLQRAGVGATSFDWPPPHDPQRPPYQGLRPLDVDDAAVFFGREAAVVRGLDALRRLCERGVEQMLVIVAASGAGKSSYLRAGLWPRLKRDDRHFFPLPIVRPGRAVLTGPTGLVVSLEAAFKQRGRPKNRADVLDALRRPNGLIGQLAELQASVSETLGGGAATVVIPIDQGEELFASEGRAESELFLRVLLTALLPPDPVGVGNPPVVPRPIALLGLRSESLGRFQEEEQLATVGRVLFELEPLPPGALKAVIEGPAECSSAAGRPLKVNPDLTEQLLKDAVGADALPLLAFTLERLFLNYGSDGELSLADYEALGKIRGAIEAAIEVAFDDPSREPVIPSNAIEREEALRHGFIPWLAVVDPYSAERRRRVAKWDEIPPEARPIFERLIKARLLIRDRRWVEASASDTVVIEIAHEALLRQWPLLNDWLELESDALKVLEDVRRAASEWAGKEHGHAWLIHEGERLEHARALLERVDFVKWLGSEGRDYIAACHAREVAAVNEREAVRIEREQARQGEIDSAHRLAEAAARVKRRSYVAAALALGVALAAGVAGVAFINARDAGEAARATSIVRGAQSLPDSDPTTAAMVLGTLQARPEPEGLVRVAARAVQGPLARAILRGHGSHIWSIAFSPDGERLLTGSSDGTARVWKTDGTGTAVVLRGHEGEVEAGSFSPDGTRVVTAGEDETARVWRADGTGEAIVLRGYEDSVEIASFNRDGTRVLTTSGDGTVRVWPADGLGEPVVLLTEGGAEVRAAFSPDGTRVVMGGEGGTTARIRRADGTGQAVVLGGHTDAIEAVAFSPDGIHVATASADGTARVWRADGTGPSVVLRGHTDDLLDVAFSPDGERVVTASADKTARVWSADGAANAVVLRGHDGKVNTAAFSSDGAHVLTTSEEDGTARVWRTDGNGTPILLRGEEPISSATFSPDGISVATGDEVGTVRVWALVPTDEPIVLRGHQGEIRTVAISPDGARVVSVGTDRTTRLWRSDRAAAGVMLPTTTEAVRGAAFTADGGSVVTATGDGSIRITRVDGTQTAVLRGWDPKVYALSFSRDGRRFVTVERDSIARVWSTRDTTAAPVVFQEPYQGLKIVAFSPDGELIAAAGENSVFVWRADGKGEPVKIDILKAKVGSGVKAVAVNSDGATVVTVNVDGKARIWPAHGTQEPIVLRGYEEEMLSVSFSLDGTQFVTAGTDGTARVWRSDGTGEPIVLKAHEGKVIDAIFSPDSKHVVTVGTDGTTRIWRITWPDLLEVLRSATTACLTILQRRMYLGEEPAAAKTAWDSCEAQHGRAPTGSPMEHK